MVTPENVLPLKACQLRSFGGSQDLLTSCELCLWQKSEEGNVPWLKGREQKKRKGWGNRKGFMVDIILPSWF